MESGSRGTLFNSSARVKIKSQVKKADGAYDERENGKGNIRRKKKLSI